MKLLIIGLLSATLANPASAPAAPTDLTATVASPTQIDLTWRDNSEDENGFGVLRCQDTECFDFGEVATLPRNATSYQDVGRTPGITYRYLVRAFNVDGNRYSNVAEATTPQIAPAAPSDLLAAPGKHGYLVWVDLAWSDGSNNESGFVIERCAGSGCADFAPAATVAAGVRAYRDSATVRRTVYRYRVRATNSAGDSAYSNVATATTR